MKISYADDENSSNLIVNIKTMFLINKQINAIQPLERPTFSELGFRERAHLQEWIENTPDALGEKLLIIQKEFSGFYETSERLDLLALDKNGNLVVIENKLDDSGRDVTWQALKYASYCSTLTKEDIRSMYQGYLDSKSIAKNAVDLLGEFFDNNDFSELKLNQRQSQRIILVASNFRKEVTSTVLWLMNFNIRIQCLKVTPYKLNDQYFLSVDQIIPTKDAQDYVISMANKAQEEFSTEVELKNRSKVRLKYWPNFLNAIKRNSTLFQNSNPTGSNTLYAGTGISGVTYQVIISEQSASVALCFGRGEQRENKILFDALISYRNEIEQSFSGKLIWERKDDLKKSLVSSYLQGVNYFIESDWPAITDFLIKNLNKLETAIRPYLPAIKQSLLESPNSIIEPLEEE